MKTRLILLLSLSIYLGSCVQKNQVTVLFNRVDGLEIGSKVYNKGIDIGNVVKIDFLKNMVITDIKLTKEIKIPVGSTFVITENLLGSSYIDVTFSDKQQTLTSTDTTFGQIKVKKLLDNLISDSTKQQQIQQSLDKIGQGVSELIQTSRDSINKNK